MPDGMRRAESLKRMGAMIASQLPESEAEARLVLDYARAIIEHLNEPCVTQCGREARWGHTPQTCPHARRNGSAVIPLVSVSTPRDEGAS